MLFLEISKLFEKLENTSKRILKILILRDFYFKYKEETSIIFDLITFNYFKELNKTNIGISVKTIFSVLEFLTSKSSNEINKKFSEVGDIGEVCVFFLKDKKQKNFQASSLNFFDVLSSIKKISNTSGKNSNKIKVEILSKLFLSAKEDSEIKFLSRLLINDLRVGVSTGTLIESILNIFIPKIINIHFKCSCGYINLGNDNCFSCKLKLDKKNQTEIIKNFKEIEEKNLEYSNLLYEKDFIYFKNPRDIYNFYFNKIEEKYNTINSFRKLFLELEKDKKNLLKIDLNYFMPIKSMLGTRLKDFSQTEKEVIFPIYADYKYDGIRLQIHKFKGEIKLFSRNLEDLTNQFREITNILKDNFKENFILDCECIAFDYSKKKYLDFQVLSRRILNKNKDTSDIKIQLKIFDILKLNNESLIHKKFNERREILEKLIIKRELIF